MLIAPTARAGGQSTLQMAVSLAYPVGDVILIVGVASLLLRGVADSTRRALWLVAGALCLFVIGDALYAYVTLHGVFANSDALNVTYAHRVCAVRPGRPLPTPSGGRRPRRSSGRDGSVGCHTSRSPSGFVVLLVSELSKTPGTAGDRCGGNGAGGHWCPPGSCSASASWSPRKAS